MATDTTTAPTLSQGQLWIRALRAPFLAASILPFFVGIAAAYRMSGVLDPLLLALSLVGVVLFHLATNMFNDNFDYRSGNDLAVAHQNPFAGGGRVLLTRRIGVNRHLLVAASFFVVGSGLGLAIFSLIGGFDTFPGRLLLGIGLVGAVAVLFYVGPPLRLANWGVGEFFVGLAFGPLVVLGAYLVQTGTISPGIVLLSLSMGLLVAAILWVNEFPDIEADLSVGKRTLVARLGAESSVPVYAGLLGAALIMPVLAAGLRLATPLVLPTLLVVPLAVRAVRGLKAHYKDPHALIPVNAGTIGLTVVFGVLLVLGLLVAALLGI